MSVWRFLALGYFLLILFGAFLLTLPISSQSGAWTDFVDALFTATSATCVTGRSQGGSHMWNAVRTPYGWVHSDFTFALGSGDVTYLDMDDRSCGVDHQWDIDIGGIWADLRGRPRSLSSNCASWRAR